MRPFLYSSCAPSASVPSIKLVRSTAHAGYFNSVVGYGGRGREAKPASPRYRRPDGRLACRIIFAAEDLAKPKLSRLCRRAYRPGRTEFLERRLEYSVHGR